MQDSRIGESRSPYTLSLGFLSLILGPLAALGVYVLSIPALPPQAHSLLAILTCVVIYWIAEPIPLAVTALLGTAACVVAGLGTDKSILASYGHPIIFLFIGSFLLAEAMVVHGVDRKLAAWMLSISWIGARPSRVLFGIGATTAAISMWISNTAATAMMLPIGLGILGTMSHQRALDHRYRTGLMLMLSYAATAGGMATMVGTPPNLIGVGLITQQLGISLSFVTWLAFGLPLGLLMLAAAWLLLRWQSVPAGNVSSLPMPDPSHEFHQWTTGQINACVAFIAAILLWIIPGLLGPLLGPQHPFVLWLETHLPNELIALLAAGLLFILPTDLRTGAMTLTWKQASNINWGIILLFGGGLAFGDLMTKTGLSDAVGIGFIHLFGTTGMWGLTAVAIVSGVLLSELASNTASASMLIPLVIAIAQADNVSPLAPALGACLGASLGFALPVSTPPNAIVYGTGLIPIKHMVFAGVLFDLIGAAVIWMTLRVICPLIGLV